MFFPSSSSNDYLQRVKSFTYRRREQLCRSPVIRQNLAVHGFEKNAGILAQKSAAADISPPLSANHISVTSKSDFLFSLFPFLPSFLLFFLLPEAPKMFTTHEQCGGFHSPSLPLSLSTRFPSLFFPLCGTSAL